MHFLSFYLLDFILYKINSIWRLDLINLIYWQLQGFRLVREFVENHGKEIKHLLLMMLLHVKII